MINWTKTQQNLTDAKFPCGAIDGVAGKITYAMLFGYVAGRQPDAILRAIGAQAVISFPKYKVDTPMRLAEFLGETSNESGGWTRFEENLHYSAKRLTQIWPTRFPTLASAAPYSWDPTDPDREDVALANLVYGNRMGNQGHGWENRGRGMLQHTGAAEYLVLKLNLGFDPDDVADPAKSLVAACDFMLRKHTFDYVDMADLKGARRSINGGLIGLAEVEAKRKKALEVIR
jgi:putative chitinase